LVEGVVGLAPVVRVVVVRLSVRLEGDTPPSEAELRIAQAQLVGWLEGLFHGIQTAIYAQQMAARAQLEQMRALPPGPGSSYGTPPGAHPAEHHQPGEAGPTGQYL
jgi:hypothetical protein